MQHGNARNSLRHTWCSEAKYVLKVSALGVEHLVPEGTLTSHQGSVGVMGTWMNIWSVVRLALCGSSK